MLCCRRQHVPVFTNADTRFRQACAHSAVKDVFLVTASNVGGSFIAALRRTMTSGTTGAGRDGSDGERGPVEMVRCHVSLGELTIFIEHFF